MSADEIKQQTARLKRAAKKEPLVVSAVIGNGVADVLRALIEVIEKRAAVPPRRARRPSPGSLKLARL